MLLSLTTDHYLASGSYEPSKDLPLDPGRGRPRGHDHSPPLHPNLTTSQEAAVLIDIDPPLTDLPLAPAKLRILLTADELFYDEGIRSVGVDRLIAASNVTKATFYKHYGSKDNVITAYIGYRHRRIAQSFERHATDHDTAVDALHAVRDAVLSDICEPRLPRVPVHQRRRRVLGLRPPRAGRGA